MAGYNMGCAGGMGACGNMGCNMACGNMGCGNNAPVLAPQAEGCGKWIPADFRMCATALVPAEGKPRLPVYVTVKDGAFASTPVRRRRVLLAGRLRRRAARNCASPCPASRPLGFAPTCAGGRSGAAAS